MRWVNINRKVSEKDKESALDKLRIALIDAYRVKDDEYYHPKQHATFVPDLTVNEFVYLWQVQGIYQKGAWDGSVAFEKNNTRLFRVDETVNIDWEYYKVQFPEVFEKVIMFIENEKTSEEQAEKERQQILENDRLERIAAINPDMLGKLVLEHDKETCLYLIIRVMEACYIGIRLFASGNKYRNERCLDYITTYQLDPRDVKIYEPYSLISNYRFSVGMNTGKYKVCFYFRKVTGDKIVHSTLIGIDESSAYIDIDYEANLDWREVGKLVDYLNTLRENLYNEPRPE